MLRGSPSEAGLHSSFNIDFRISAARSSSSKNDSVSASARLTAFLTTVATASSAAGSVAFRSIFSTPAGELRVGDNSVLMRFNTIGKPVVGIGEEPGVFGQLVETIFV